MGHTGPVTRYGFLGPEGTFTQMALLAWRPAEGAEHVPFGSVDAALTAALGPGHHVALTADAGPAEAPPRWYRGGGPTPPRPRPANNEAEDIASSAEAPPCRQRGGGFPPLH